MRSACIIVTFNSEIRNLSQQLGHLRNIFEDIIIVDNSTDLSSKDEIAYLCEKEKIELLKVVNNIGIGAAQNLGLQLIKDRGVERVMFLDDDSCFPENEIETLFDQFEMIKDKKPWVIGAGPLVKDVRSGETIAFGWEKNILRRIDTDRSVKEVAFLISSGSLYDFNILTNQIGFLREDYFLDGIDMELGLRITSKGYKTVVIGSSKMIHYLGDHVKKDNFGKTFYAHEDPVRLYYQTRNHLLILKDLPIKATRKYLRVLQIFKQFQFLAKLRSRKFVDLHMFYLGVLHAVLERRGPYKKP